MERDRQGPLSTAAETNTERIIGTLAMLGVASRAELARQTGLSRSTVSALVTRLEDRGLVVPHADGDRPEQTGSGRPPTLITLDPSALLAVGIDFGKRHLAVAVADLAHNVLAERWLPMPDGYDADYGFAKAEAAMAEISDRPAIDRDRFLGVGVGVPGPVTSRGEVGSSAILPGWAGVRVADDLSARLDLHVEVENDANLGALAEYHWGAGIASRASPT